MNNTEKLLLAASVSFVASGFLIERVGPVLPLGIRNNNPLNIRYNENNDWDGQTGEEKGFSVFSNPLYGIRAATKLLKSYRRLGVKTLSSIIDRWAPPHENKTSIYVAFVSKETGIASDAFVDESRYVDLLAAMIKMENGVQPYSTTDIARGVALA